MRTIDGHTAHKIIINMRQIATVISCVAVATIGWNLSKVVTPKQQNTAMASVPLTELLSPIRTEVHDTVPVPDSIAYVEVPVPRPVHKYIVRYRDRVKDNASIVDNKTSEEGLRVTSPVSDTVSTDVQSSHISTREDRKGTPPDSLHEHIMEIRGYIWPISEKR